MWSLGCIVVELFLGLPLFPGSSEYNQVARIEEMLGLPPTWMLEMGKQSGEFFEKAHDEYGRRNYRLKSMEQYSREHGTKEAPSKKYFTAKTLPDIIKGYPLPRKNMKPAEIERGKFVHVPQITPKLISCRNGQQSSVHRLCAGIAEPESFGKMDAQPGKNAPLHHPGQIHGTIRATHDIPHWLEQVACSRCTRAATR